MAARKIRPLEPADIVLCEVLLDALPEWFGLEATNRAYIESLSRLPGFVAVDGAAVIGFLALEDHAPGSVEITVMAVDPLRHRQGTGRALIDAALSWCEIHDVRWLHVKTRGPSTYDDDYEKTRRFYASMGFEVLYESLTEWGPEDAALVMVMRLGD